MLVLCDRCIRGVRSRGETLYISDVIEHDDICFWCEDTENDLFHVVYNPLDNLDRDCGGLKGGENSEQQRQNHT